MSGEIVLANDDQIRVVIDPALSGKQEFLRHREKSTNRIIARLSPDLFSSRRVKFLENAFDVFFVANCFRQNNLNSILAIRSYNDTTEFAGIESRA